MSTFVISTAAIVKDRPDRRCQFGPYGKHFRTAAGTGNDADCRPLHGFPLAWIEAATKLQTFSSIFPIFRKDGSMNSRHTVQALRALAHDHRLAAYRALAQAGPEGLAVGQLREALDLPAATMTAHLNQLRAVGLVTDEREGRVIRIRADFQHMNALVGFLAENCCGGRACAPATKEPRRRVFLNR
ncbi:metalloregulator ArsR/SmtB family transcription factor [Pseudoxanthomonas putridarboris]|uniref:Metalloregulator ArsR/SmtB family transcription factor n=1 Tax=Pseudoxanthomonas putridarboris TaxID=752605 RepID=A0ABU9J0P1_9GAMM